MKVIVPWDSIEVTDAAVKQVFPFRVEQNMAHKLKHLYRWCRDEVGGKDGVDLDSAEDNAVIIQTKARWCHCNSGFWFKDEAHAFAFRLRWS